VFGDNNLAGLRYDFSGSSRLAAVVLVKRTDLTMKLLFASAPPTTDINVIIGTGIASEEILELIRSDHAVSRLLMTQTSIC
jgi:hypothetical protein